MSSDTRWRGGPSSRSAAPPPQVSSSRCGGSSDTPTQEPAKLTDTRVADVVLDFSQTTGVLNYTYGLEQLAAAFYTAVNDSLYSGARPVERAALEEIGAHELAHREFFKAVLGSDAIGALKPDFSEVDFSSRGAHSQGRTGRGAAVHQDVRGRPERPG